MAFNPSAIEFVPGQAWGGQFAGSICDGHEEYFNYLGLNKQFADAQDYPSSEEAFAERGRCDGLARQKGWLALRPANNTSGVGSALAWRAASASAGLPMVLPNDLPAKVSVWGEPGFPALPASGREPFQAPSSAPPARLAEDGDPTGDGGAGAWLHRSSWDAPQLQDGDEQLLGNLIQAMEDNVEPRGLDYTWHSTDNSSAEMTCRWHESAKTVGVVSGDGHIFTKLGSKRKVCVRNQGTPVELAAICMVFDETLRCGGLHNYNYRILDGELGSADGAGFVFDSKVRRKNIQQMRSVFLNQRGCICVRDHEHVKKVGAQLPPLMAGMSLNLRIDLDSFQLQFAVFGLDGLLSGHAEVSIGGCFGGSCAGEPFHSGFFCAVVTKEISVALA
mmetsp:Transcript_52260/g.167549  ORF Transcript_52260/g.167549 Transcript_52260/m.167549 type:complete len:390 (+) Transcript_52260:98-1267(+)